MRIAWVINLFPPYVMGGNEILARDIIGDLRDRGHAIYVLTGRGIEFEDNDAIVTALDIDLDRKDERFMGGKRPSWRESAKWHVFDFRTYRKLSKALAEIEPNLIVVDNLSLISPSPLLAARRSEIPTIVQANDVWLLHGLKDRKGPGLWHTPPEQQFLIGWLKGLTQLFLRNRCVPDRIIANSQFIKNIHIARGFDGESIQVIHLGIDTDLFRPRPELQPDETPLRFVFAGQLWEGKGPQVAIASLGLLRERFPSKSFIFEICGSGAPHFIDYLKQVSIENGVDDIVYFNEFMPLENLARFFCGQHIYLFPSIWNEPFSLTLLSAMACGLPTIASTAGGTPEAIRHGQTGLLVPPDDAGAMEEAMERLVEAPEYRRKLGYAAAEEVRQRWSFKAYVDRLEAEYLSAASAHHCVDEAGECMEKIQSKTHGCVADYLGMECWIDLSSTEMEGDIETYAAKDNFPIPLTEDREGYHGERHLDYWVSGLKDYLSIKNHLTRLGVPLPPCPIIYDLGCASGRVLRHFVCNEPSAQVWASDIKPAHAEWVQRHLGNSVRIFTNSVIPALPFEDCSLDLVYAFSVFTHIEELELAWIAEIRRALKANGIAYLSVHSDHTWASITPAQQLFHDLRKATGIKGFHSYSPDLLEQPMPEPRMVFLYEGGDSHIFHSTEYIKNSWGRFFDLLEIVREGSDYQDVVILRKD